MLAEVICPAFWDFKGWRPTVKMKSVVLFFKRLWLRLFPGDRLLLQGAIEAPDHLAPGTAYVIGENDYQWHVVMGCPCGCGASIYLNLLPDDRPLWELACHGDGTFSLSPSVWRTTGCRSHFFVRRSRVEWCGKPR